MDRVFKYMEWNLGPVGVNGSFVIDFLRAWSCLMVRSDSRELHFTYHYVLALEFHIPPSPLFFKPSFTQDLPPKPSGIPNMERGCIIYSSFRLSSDINSFLKVALLLAENPRVAVYLAIKLSSCPRVTVWVQPCPLWGKMSVWERSKRQAAV